MTAIAVMTLSAAGVGAAVRVHPASPARFVAASGGDRIAFPEGIRVRYPAGWSLVEFGGTLTSTTPLFQLTSYPPRRPVPAGCSAPVPPHGVVLVVARSRGNPIPQRIPMWPVPLTRSRSALGCLIAGWDAWGWSYQAWVSFGPQTRETARHEMMAAFRSMRFPPALAPGSRNWQAGRAGFVVTSGFDLGRPAAWVARASPDGPCLMEVVSAGPTTGPCRALRLHGGVSVIGTGPGTVVVGIVSRRVRSVQAQLAGGETVPAEVVPAPPMLRERFNFFVIELPVQSRGRVVARDATGQDMGTASFDPPPLPVIGHGGVPGRTWVLLDREQDNGARCIDFDKGLGDQGSICPTAVPSSRDVQATLMPLGNRRSLVVGVVSKRVWHVQIRYMNSRFVASRLIHLPKVLLHRSAVLPAPYNLFVASIGLPEGAVVVAFDREWHPIDGLPLSTGGGAGD